MTRDPTFVALAEWHRLEMAHIAAIRESDDLQSGEAWERQRDASTAFANAKTQFSTCGRARNPRPRHRRVQQLSLPCAPPRLGGGPSGVQGAACRPIVCQR